MITKIYILPFYIYNGYYLLVSIILSVILFSYIMGILITIIAPVCPLAT